MTPLRTSLVVLLGLGAVAFLLWGGEEPPAADGEWGVGETTPRRSVPGEGLSGRGIDAPDEDGAKASDEAAGPQTHRFVVRHGEEGRPLAGIRIDDEATGYVGTSDDAGRLEVVLEGGAGRFVFEATGRGYLLSKGVARAGVETEVFMTPGTPLRGTVRDATSKQPLADALVRAWDEDAGRFGTASVPTDEAGRFELLGVRLAHPFTLLVRVEGRPTATSRHQVFEPDTELTVLVGGPGHVEGRVVGPGDKPAVGVEVQLVAPGERLAGDERPHDPWKGPRRTSQAERERQQWSAAPVRTDETGAFAFEGVPLGRFFEAAARIDRREQVRSAPFVLSERRPAHELTLERQARGTLAVAFLDRHGGAVGPARFRLEGAHVDFPLPTETPIEADERRRFEEVPAGAWTLEARVARGPVARRTVSVEAGKTTSVTLQTVVGEVISGSLVGPAGEPIAGGRVTWVPRGRDEPRVVVDTDRRGRFLMRGVLGVCRELVFEPPMTYMARSRYRKLEAVGVAAGGRDLSFALPGREGLVGHVVGRTDVGRVHVSVVTERFRHTTRLRLGEKGRFFLSRPPEGEGLIVFRAPGFSPALIPYESVEELDHELYRVWLDVPVTIPITVHDEGQPASGVRIRPADERLDLAWRTDRHGEADLTGLPPGATKLVIDSEWHLPKTVAVEPSVAGKRTHVQLGAAGGRVEGSVTSRGGGRARAVVLAPRGTARHELVKKGHAVEPPPEGTFSILVPPGTYVVWTIGIPPWPFRRGRVRVRARETTYFLRR